MGPFHPGSVPARPAARGRTELAELERGAREGDAPPGSASGHRAVQRPVHEGCATFVGMKIIDSPITVGELASMAEVGFGDLVKAVVDVKRGIMAVDGELHSDEEALLLESGSEQHHLWGINLYPALARADLIEFDSLINIRPSQGNRSRGVGDPDIREQIVRVVDSLVIL